MPLVDVWLRPGFQLQDEEIAPIINTREFLRGTLGPQLPGLLARNAEALGLDAGTPEDGVQVQFHDYDEDDVNTVGLWVKIQFSEEPPTPVVQLDIRDAVFALLIRWLESNDVRFPEDFAVDVFWGPGHGVLAMNGRTTKW